MARNCNQPERPYREDKARIPRPLANYIPIHYKPGEPPTHQLRFKSGPNAQSSLSIALPTKATRGEIHFVRSTHNVTTVLSES